MTQYLIIRRKNGGPLLGSPPDKSARLANATVCVMASLPLLLVLLFPVLCASSEFNEYQVKAEFIYNLVRFTDWPNKELANSRSIKICTLGTDPFNSSFQSLNGRVTKGKTLTIRHLDQIEDIEGCHVLFISTSERKQIPRILKHVKNDPILTVSEVESFAKSGGMVNLLLESNKTVLEINNVAVHRNKLKISSQVLKLARIVSE